MLANVLITALCATEPGAPLLLTSGWQAVLDVPEVRAAVVEDPSVAAASDAHDGTVTLLGKKPGQTQLWAFAGDRVFLYPVVVTRFPTLLPLERILRLKVDEHRIAKLDGATRISVADPGICRAVIGPDGVQLTGRRSGTTTLIAFIDGKPRYLLIDVRGGDVTPTANELDEELTEPGDGRVVLRVGERGVFDAPGGLLRFAMKDERVADVKPRDGELVFEGRRIGATRVLFWDAHGKPASRYVVVLPRVEGDPDPVPPPDPSGPVEPVSPRVDDSL